MFPSKIHVGVCLGDPLSPDRFKLFINDLSELFYTLCCGVDTGVFHLNCLLYADDVILFIR